MKIVILAAHRLEFVVNNSNSDWREIGLGYCMLLRAEGFSCYSEYEIANRRLVTLIQL